MQTTVQKLESLLHQLNKERRELSASKDATHHLVSHEESCVVVVRDGRVSPRCQRKRAGMGKV